MQSSLIWVAYAIAIAVLVVLAALFVLLYEKPGERAASATIVCIITLSSLLATVLLLPVDVALVSSTNRLNHGIRKDWATPDHVDSILYTLQIVYYTLYSLDAMLCCVVVPFTYFWCEEYDEALVDEGRQTIASRFWGAFKYTAFFILLVILLFVVGFFIPFAQSTKDKHLDIDYFRRLLMENRTEPNI